MAHLLCVEESLPPMMVHFQILPVQLQVSLTPADPPRGHAMCVEKLLTKRDGQIQIGYPDAAMKRLFPSHAVTACGGSGNKKARSEAGPESHWVRRVNGSMGLA
jgi:hypothetical protein